MSTVQEKIQDLRTRREKAKSGGTKRIEKQHASGKLSARERIEKFFDQGRFIELDQFVVRRCTNLGMTEKELLCEGVVTGYGTVNGRLVYAYAQDFTVEGGSLGEIHAAKIIKVQKLAMTMGAPLIGINDSNGTRIQADIDALSGYGKIFYYNTLASGVIPQISVMIGPCAGAPALTDFIFMVKNTSQLFMTGPQVTESITAEEVTAEALGGAMTHNSTSGVAHFATENETDCIAQIRALLSYVPNNNLEETPLFDNGDDPDRMEENLLTILPDNPNQPYDMKGVIKAIVDHGEYLEVQPHYAQNIITCFARFAGQSVGIIANQPLVMAGGLDINAADKSARFIRFCDAFNIPLVNLVDVPGFLPGTGQEYGGIMHGAKMLYAYSEATVPKITVIIRRAYGGSYLAMCSQDLGADQVLAWPTAEIAVKGPASAANIIFRDDHDVAAKTERYLEESATPYQAAERGFVDQIIEPIETRPQIITALNMLATKRETRPAKKHGNIPL